MPSLISMFLLVSILYIAFLQLREFNKMTLCEYRFKYFALRDKLAILVVDRKIKEDSWEYKNIINTINFHISTIETMSIMRIAQLLIAYHTSQNEDNKVKALAKKVENKDVAEIIIEYMSITQSLIRRNSKTQIFLLNIANYLFKALKVGPVHKASINRHDLIQNPNQALLKIDSRKSSFESLVAA